VTRSSHVCSPPCSILYSFCHVRPRTARSPRSFPSSNSIRAQDISLHFDLLQREKIDIVTPLFPLRPCSLFLLFRNSCFYHLRRCHFLVRLLFRFPPPLYMHFLAVSARVPLCYQIFTCCFSLSVIVNRQTVGVYVNE
jgi:hypothetical protein